MRKIIPASKFTLPISSKLLFFYENLHEYFFVQNQFLIANNENKLKYKNSKLFYNCIIIVEKYNPCFVIISTPKQPIKMFRLVK